MRYYEQARAQFSEKELGDLNIAVILIHAWNRIAIPFQSVFGSCLRRRTEGPYCGFLFKRLKFSP